jgi:hypothetical protein
MANACERPVRADRPRLKTSIKSGEKPTKKLAKAMAALEMCRALKVLKKKKSEANEELEPSSQD